MTNISKLLSGLVAINSVFPNEVKLSEYLENYLKNIGFKVSKQKIGEKRFNLLAEKGDGDKSVMFYGHMDTVPLIKLDEWKTNPFELTELEGKLYGLGVSDMKSGIAAILESVSSTSKYVKIFFASDEENISEGAWKAIQEREEFFKDVELIISAEPNFGRGIYNITTGRTGRCIFSVNFVGKPKHIIDYKNAIDPIEKFCNFGQKLYSLRESLFNSKDTVVQIRKVESEAKGMSVADNLYAEIEVLLGKEDSIQSVQEKLQTLTEDLIILKDRKTPYLQGYSFDNFLYKDVIAKVIENNCHKKMELSKRSSVGDDNVLATLGIPVLTWGSTGGNEHSANEYVEIKSLITLVEMYKEFMDKIQKLERR
ncbi:ArgE/DapE family deacylase [soil metagenome]